MPIRRKMLEQSDQVFILADSSKFERTAMLKLADTSAEYRYVTDHGLPDGLRQLYEQNGINIITG